MNPYLILLALGTGVALLVTSVKKNAKKSDSDSSGSANGDANKSRASDSTNHGHGVTVHVHTNGETGSDKRGTSTSHSVGNESDPARQSGTPVNETVRNSASDSDSANNGGNSTGD